ncbi:hypothetical protein ACEOWG_004518 [Bacillus cereus]
MARPNRFQIMELYKNDIKECFEEMNKDIFTVEEINGILWDNRTDWKLPFSTTAEDLIIFLMKKKWITNIDLEFPKRVFQRYIFNKTIDEIRPIEMACSLFKKSYLSHHTAAFYHNLTDNIVKPIFINNEQTYKGEPFESELDIEQEAIDNAFAKEMRISKNIAKYQDREIHILNGKYTGNLGVNEENKIKVTNIERTLIDIAVRPDYAGGVFEILDIYKNAKGEASVNKIYSYLNKLNHIYPYHQVIGFYLERAGYKESALKLMERFPIKYNFYLTYNIKNRLFSERWKLYYPAHFDL